MWASLIERFTDWTVMTCTFLAFFIPYIIYKINQIYQKIMDPPWKKDES